MLSKELPHDTTSVGHGSVITSRDADFPVRGKLSAKHCRGRTAIRSGMGEGQHRRGGQRGHRSRGQSPLLRGEWGCGSSSFYFTVMEHMKIQ